MTADLLLWGAAADTASANRQPLIYVAPLPAKYNVDLLYKEGAQGCEDFAAHVLANPTGALVDTAVLDGLRHTPYYGMEPYMHMQLLNAPFRTTNMTQADIVYVPFYATLLVYGHTLAGCYPAYTKDEQDALVASFWESVDVLLPMLASKPHWLALAQLEGEVLDGCGGWAVGLLCHPRASSLVVTVPEPMAEYTNNWHTFGSAIKLHDNVVAVPYMGHVHRMVFHQPAADELLEMKSHLVATSFATHRFAGLRTKLMHDCNNRSSACIYKAVKYQGSLQNVADVMQAYSKSWFCAQPPGDTPLRLAIYDCLALGALPVFFDPFVVHHLPFADIIQYEDFVTVIEDAESAPNIIDRLDEQVSASRRLQMVAALQRVAQVFQYVVTPVYSLVRFDTMHAVVEHDDAFTATLKAVLRNVCGRGQLPAERCSSSQGGSKWAE